MPDVVHIRYETGGAGEQNDFRALRTELERGPLSASVELLTEQQARDIAARLSDREEAPRWQVSFRFESSFPATSLPSSAEVPDGAKPKDVIEAARRRILDRVLKMQALLLSQPRVMGMQAVVTRQFPWARQERRDAAARQCVGWENSIERQAEEAGLETAALQDWWANLEAEGRELAGLLGGNVNVRR